MKDLLTVDIHTYFKIKIEYLAAERMSMDDCSALVFHNAITSIFDVVADRIPQPWL